MAHQADNQRLWVPYALAVHGNAEKQAVLRVLEGHKTILGPCTKRFESKVARIFGKRFGIMVNSGSSANLLALEVLRLPPGAEIITPALTFSTTVAPIVQKGLVPAFVDVEPHTFQIDVSRIQEQITPRTRALMVPLLLGNVPDMNALREICDRYDLWFIEDSCDTLGARFRGDATGSFSDVSTTSFYGSHIITAAGGGGMVCVSDPALARSLRVLRGWGRRSSALEESEDVSKRYRDRLDDIPYDAKFVFDAIGYNFLPLEISAAFGEAQLRRLHTFSQVRSQNVRTLVQFFGEFEQFFELPAERPDAEANWLAFPLTIRENSPFSRLEIVQHLEKYGIQTRPLFTGNILRHPGFREIRARVTRDGYPVADYVMQNSFLVGCHQGLTRAHLDHMKQVCETFLRTYA